jgi:predicted ester cyclase
MPHTGRKVTAPAIYLFEIRNGKIVHADVSFDTMTMMAQMGLMPGA